MPQSDLLLKGEPLKGEPGTRSKMSLRELEALRAERIALDELSREGILGEETLIELQAELDEAIYQSESRENHV